jgi:hypothetical protein
VLLLSSSNKANSAPSSLFCTYTDNDNGIINVSDTSTTDRSALITPFDANDKAQTLFHEGKFSPERDELSNPEKVATLSRVVLLLMDHADPQRYDATTSPAIAFSTRLTDRPRDRLSYSQILETFYKSFF